MLKEVLNRILYLLFDVESKENIKITKGQNIIINLIVTIILIGLLFAFVYCGLNALAFKKQTLGVIILLIAFVFTFVVLLKVVRIGR